MKTNEPIERLMPAPRSLGGGTITVFRCGGPKLGDCTAPGCSARAKSTCTYQLGGKAAGKTCDRPVCEKHGVDVLCPGHRRLVEQQKGRVRAWM